MLCTYMLYVIVEQHPVSEPLSDISWAINSLTPCKPTPLNSYDNQGLKNPQNPPRHESYPQIVSDLPAE